MQADKTTNNIHGHAWHREKATSKIHTWLAYLAHASRHFLEALVEGEVVSHRVLPSSGGCAIERELPLYPVVYLLHWQGLGRRALQRHEYHTGERQRRLLRVFPVVFLVPDVEDDTEHSLRVQLCLSRSLLASSGSPRPSLRSSGTTSNFIDAMRGACESRAHGGEDARLLEPGERSQLSVYGDDFLVLARGLRQLSHLALG